MARIEAEREHNQVRLELIAKRHNEWDTAAHEAEDELHSWKSNLHMDPELWREAQQRRIDDLGKRRDASTAEYHVLEARLEKEQRPESIAAKAELQARQGSPRLFAHVEELQKIESTHATRELREKAEKLQAQERSIPPAPSGQGDPSEERPPQQTLERAGPAARTPEARADTKNLYTVAREDKNLCREQLKLAESEWAIALEYQRETARKEILKQQEKDKDRLEIMKKNIRICDAEIKGKLDERDNRVTFASVFRSKALTAEIEYYQGERAKNYEKATSLVDQLNRELSPEAVRDKAAELAARRDPELSRRRTELSKIEGMHSIREIREKQEERQLQWEKEHPGQAQRNMGRGRSRFDDDFGRGL